MRRAAAVKQRRQAHLTGGRLREAKCTLCFRRETFQIGARAATIPRTYLAKQFNCITPVI